jgi:hypothetical protein
LAFSNGWNLRRIVPWIAVGAFLSIRLYEGFRNGPHTLRSDVRVTCFRSLPFKYVSTGHSLDWFRFPLSTASSGCCHGTSSLVGLLPRKIPNFLRSVKDDLGLKMLGVYSIPCECSQVCIGQTGRSIDTRLKERQRHVRLEHPDKSAVAKHRTNLGHPNQLHDPAILSTKPRYMISYQGGDWDWAPAQQYEQGGWLLVWAIHRKLMCSMNSCMKPASHGGRCGFSVSHTGPCTMSFSLHPDIPAYFSSPTACRRLTDFTSVLRTSILCLTHPYTFHPSLYAY